MTIITQKTAFYVGHIEQLPRHFCFESEGCFVFGNDAQRHTNKGAHSTTDCGTLPHAIGWFHWPMWLADGLYVDPILFSRDTLPKSNQL